MDDLKPCPFCGYNQQLYYVELSNGLHYIECARCGAAPHMLGAWNRETAVKYWNSSNRWISCSERLPETGKEVLAFVKGELEKFSVTAYQDEEGDWISDYYGDVIDSEVTHWMPLPEPPKEGASDD